MAGCNTHRDQVLNRDGTCGECVENMRRERDPQDAYETVDHPPHYGGDTPLEHVKVALALSWDRYALVYNATKYLWRLGLKPGAKDVEDIKKAIWYLDYEVFRRTGRHVVQFSAPEEPEKS